MHPLAARAVNILQGLEVRRKPVLNFLDCILEGIFYSFFRDRPFGSNTVGVHTQIAPQTHRGFVQNFSSSCVRNEGIEADPTIRLLDSVYVERLVARGYTKKFAAVEAKQSSNRVCDFTKKVADVSLSFLRIEVLCCVLVLAAQCLQCINELLILATPRSGSLIVRLQHSQFFIVLLVLPHPLPPFRPPRPAVSWLFVIDWVDLD
jgi:hypothetical protein